MFKSSNNTKTLAIAITAALTIFMIIGPLAQTSGNNPAFAKSKETDNGSEQNRLGKQSSEQESMCVNGESIALSCNNLSAQGQSNDGHSASGQKDGGEGDNDSDQNSKQEQDSKQESMCVAGESIALSCNNLSAQGQSNDGHSASGQKDGGEGDNDSDQSSKQEQDSKQESMCVSGEDAIVSCNNVEFQNLINSGNSALAQN